MHGPFETIGFPTVFSMCVSNIYLNVLGCLLFFLFFSWGFLFVVMEGGPSPLSFCLQYIIDTFYVILYSKKITSKFQIICWLLSYVSSLCNAKQIFLNYISFKQLVLYLLQAYLRENTRETVYYISQNIDQIIRKIDYIPKPKTDDENHIKFASICINIVVEYKNVINSHLSHLVQICDWFYLTSNCYFVSFFIHIILILF